MQRLIKIEHLSIVGRTFTWEAVEAEKVVILGFEEFDLFSHDCQGKVAITEGLTGGLFELAPDKEKAITRATARFTRMGAAKVQERLDSVICQDGLAPVRPVGEEAAAQVQA